MPLDIDRVQAALPGRTILYRSVVDSTMLLAASLNGHGDVALADQQTAGIGRYNRGWHSEPDHGLYFTVVLARSPWPIITLTVGLAVRDAIASVAGLDPDIRWPNDLLLNGKKCCGILTQAHEDRVLAGIGINVNHTSFPEALTHLATSLRLESSGKSIDREALLIDALSNIDRCIELPVPSILDAFTFHSSYAIGRRVTVELNGVEVHGSTAGLNEHGYLLLDDDFGRRHTILAGGVRPCS